MIPETYYKLYPYNLAKHMFDDIATLEMILPGKLIEEVEISLTERESKCIKLRYSEGMTLDQIAAEFKVTRERIRQIIAKAERKLKNVARTNRYFATTAESLKKAQLEIIELKQYIKANENIDPLELAWAATPIDELELSVRSYNCLKRAGFNVLGKFKGVKIRDIARIRNLGPRSFSEIMGKLSDVGFMASNGTDIYPINDWTDYFSDDTLVWIAGEE
jgi:DNA-directed RNA polymerase alpha subunit